MLLGSRRHQLGRPCPYCVEWHTLLGHMHRLYVLVVLGLEKKQRKEALLRPGAVGGLWL